MQIHAPAQADLFIAKILLKPSRCRLVKFIEPVGMCRLLAMPNRLSDLDPDFSAKVPDHLWKTIAGNAAQKREDIAACAASKTMKDLPRRTDGKGRTFLLMKGTQPFEVLAGFGQRYVVAYNVGDVNPVLYLIDQFVSNQASAHESRNSCRTRQARPDGSVAKLWKNRPV